MSEDNNSDCDGPRKTRMRTVKTAIKAIIDSDSEDDLPRPSKKRRRAAEDDWKPDEDNDEAKPSKTKATKKAPVPRKGIKKEIIEDGDNDENKPSILKKEAVNDSEPPVKKARKTPATKSTTKEIQIKKENVDGAADTCNKDATDKHESKPKIVASMYWEEPDLLADREGLEHWVARNLTRLFEEDNTIPFIARYRKELTRGMEPEQLRRAKETFEEIKTIKNKASNMLKSIEKVGKLSRDVEKSILCARSLTELEHINTPFKTGSKRTYAERARQLGLEPAALSILHGTESIMPSRLINTEKEGLCTEEDVKLGVQHIIADIISKDRDVLDYVDQIRKTSSIVMESSRARGTTVKERVKAGKSEKTVAKPGKSANPTKPGKPGKPVSDEESKYKLYFDFKMDVRGIKPHQVLALNRGESEKELTVKVNVPENLQGNFTSFCMQHWLCKGLRYPLRTTIVSNSVKDCYARLIQPLIVRHVRAELNQQAERASIDVFAANLKKLLLSPPYRGHTILGVDPGFRNGCKVALVSQSGDVLETGVLMLHWGKPASQFRGDENAQWLRDTLLKHRCQTIALGNGSACRETEEYLVGLIQQGWFKPDLDVTYTIISEQGASIYSCGDEAKKEFPYMDPNIISAVSIARRLQDPLAELVKVEPKHLGVGMYQHDLPEKRLSSCLNEVVVECVSFVGVDLNAASHCLLRQIAGLNASRAEKIQEYRRINGPFLCRDDLKKVKGIGEKTFEQCAGFIRIIPETAGNKSKKYNPLDRTWIHPESYSLARRLIDFCGAKLDDFGGPKFNEQILKSVQNAGGTSKLGQMLKESEAVIKLIVDGLNCPLNYDLRSEFQKPLFRRDLKSMQDLNSGDILTGRVTNVTHFGAFVDIGVGRNGLIPLRYMNNKSPQLGDKIQVMVFEVEIARQRIALKLLEIL